MECHTAELYYTLAFAKNPAMQAISR
jgi:hypothetical protein